MIASTSALYVNGIGRVYLSELICLVTVVWLVLQQRESPTFGGRRQVILLGVLWFTATLASAAIHDSPGGLIAKSTSNIVVLGINLTALWMVCANSKRSAVPPLCWGLLVAGLSSLVFRPDFNTLLDPWKFALGFPISLLLAVYLSRRPRSLASIVPFALLGLLHVALGSRSLGAICLVAVGVVMFAGGNRPAEDAAAGRRRSMLMTAFVLVLAAWGTSAIYGTLAGSGRLGETAQMKYVGQSSGELGVVGGGRTEIYFALPAVVAAPLLGLGSDPKLTGPMVNQGIALADRLGYPLGEWQLNFLIHDGSVPTHSHLMQAWVESGLAGAAFWICLIVIIARTVAVRIRDGSVTVLDGLLGFHLLWDILFSPLGAQARLMFALQFTVLMLRPVPAENADGQEVRSTTVHDHGSRVGATL
jgi:hypothetical protein